MCCWLGYCICNIVPCLYIYMCIGLFIVVRVCPLSVCVNTTLSFTSNNTVLFDHGLVTARLIISTCHYLAAAYQSSSAAYARYRGCRASNWRVTGTSGIGPAVTCYKIGSDTIRNFAHNPSQQQFVLATCVRYSQIVAVADTSHAHELEHIKQ